MSSLGGHRTPVGDVAVVIPVHNRADLLPATLATVFAQVPAPAEVIVVDDASTDDSADVAALHGARVIRRTECAGSPGPARNDGMAASDATWVAFCDSDDLWAQGHLAGLLTGVEPGVVLVSAPARTSDGGWLGNPFGRRMRVDAAAVLAPGMNLVVSATMVRRDAALAAGGFTTRLAEDLDLWLRVLNQGAAVLTAEPTVIYLVHPGQMSHDGGVVAEAELIVAEHEADAWFGPHLGDRWSSQLRWDDLRRALARRDGHAAATSARLLLRSPASLTGVASLLVYRRRVHAAIRNSPPLRPAVASAHPGDGAASSGGEVHPAG